MKTFELEIETLTLVPVEGGRFEVTANDRLVFSKLQTHRHAEPGEIVQTIRKLLREEV